MGKFLAIVFVIGLAVTLGPLVALGVLGVIVVIAAIINSS